MKPRRQRASVIIIRDDTALLVYRRNLRGEYYVVPGGGTEPDESVETAARREILEEVGVQIVDLEKFAEYEDSYSEQRFHFFTARLDGAQKVGWQESHLQKPDDLYRLEWIPFDLVASLSLKPDAMRQAIADHLMARSRNS